MTSEISWAQRTDMPGILAAEASTPNPMPEDAIMRWLRQRDVVGITARIVNRKKIKVVGYAIYRLHKKNVELLRLVVRPEYRDDGIGTALLRQVRTRAGKHVAPRRRSSVVCELSNFEDLRMLDWLGNRASFVRPTENGVRFIFTPYREEA